MRRILLFGFVLSFLVAPHLSNASFFGKSKTTNESVSGPSGYMKSAYIYVNSTLKKVTAGLHCNRFMCGREGGSTSWEKSIGCILDGKLHINCWKKILKEITAIDAGKVKKGTFFSGYEALPAHVQDYLKVLLISKIGKKLKDTKLAGDFILTFLEGKKKEVPDEILKVWKKSGNHYLGQVYEVEEGRATIGQVILVAPGYEAELGGIFVIHPDKANPLEVSVANGTSANGLYVGMDTLLGPKRRGAAKIATSLSNQYFGIGANYLLATYQKI